MNSRHDPGEGLVDLLLSLYRGQARELRRYDLHRKVGLASQTHLQRAGITLVRCGLVHDFQSNQGKAGVQSFAKRGSRGPVCVVNELDVTSGVLRGISTGLAGPSTITSSLVGHDQDLLEFALLVHLHDDVCSSDQLPRDVELRNRGPLAELLHSLSNARVVGFIQDVDGLERHADLAKETGGSSGEAALRHRWSSLHEQKHRI
mmetsp:Transcript_80474/g.111782  ORF Transcript_80474/g.111782 Transcript_80474/m.111782 type:complete len:204 (-) Transcript_80474:583-1194(-)